MGWMVSVSCVSVDGPFWGEADHRTYLFQNLVVASCSVQGHFGVIRCTFLKMACNSKTAGHIEPNRVKLGTRE